MPSDEMRGSAAERSLDLETGLDNAAKLLAETSNPKSRAADELKRQICDGQGLNRLARTELRMPEVLVSWYRRLLDALKNYPALIRRGTSELKTGADIFEIGFDRWHEFKTNGVHFLLNEFRTTCDAFTAAADKLDERKRRKSEGSATPEDEFDFEVARAMILVGRVPPADWMPFITHLHFGTRRLRNLTHLTSLTHLRSLTHVAARVHDLSPLAGLISLETVDIWGTKATDLGPLASLTNLRFLNVGWTKVRGLKPLADLKELHTLVLSGTPARDLTPWRGCLACNTRPRVYARF